MKRAILKSAGFTVTETLKETYSAGGSYEGTSTLTFTPGGNRGPWGRSSGSGMLRAPS